MHYKEELLDLYLDLLDYDELESSYKIENPASKKLRKKAVKKGMHTSIIEFYEEMDGFKLEWNIYESEEPDIRGRIQFIPLEDVLTDWEGNLYDEDTPEESDLRKFHPIDLFTEETHVGIFLEKGKSKELYLHAYGDDEIYPLYLDLEGYVKMMIAAKGFLYWQLVILEILMGKESVESERFKEEMPKLFKNFSFEEFVKKFEELKINI